MNKIKSIKNSLKTINTCENEINTSGKGILNRLLEKYKPRNSAHGSYKIYNDLIMKDVA